MIKRYETRDQIKKLTQKRLEFDGINQAAISRNFWYEVFRTIDSCSRTKVLNIHSDAMGKSTIIIHQVKIKDGE